MTGTIKVRAAVLDKQRLILYKDDASTVVLEQGDDRILPILNQITPILNAGGIAVVALGPEQKASRSSPNEYARFQKKTNGLVKLFRVAKHAVAYLFGADEDRNQELADATFGQVPEQTGAAKQTSAAALNEIMTHAQPVTDRKFREAETTEAETMVAVIGEGKDTKIIPGVEALRGQFAHANSKLGSPKGVQRLLERLGKVIEQRGHSVQDVMRFLERGDLPIADDGSILAYKVLRKHSTKPNTFVDCHTQKVPQKVGSVVRVAEHLVDRNRREECSNGLHIARRGYIGSFPGDVCVLIKLAPEDVIAVPHGDPNKVRVCAYHIIGLLSPEEHTKLRNNRPMTDTPDTQRMLAAAIKGQHVGQLEEVRVNGHLGTDVKVTPLVESKTQAPIRPALAKKAGAPKAKAIPEPRAKSAPVAPTKTAPPVDPKIVSQKVAAQKAEPTRSQLAAELIGTVMNFDLPLRNRKEAADALVALKKRTKVTYGVLGLSTRQEKVLQVVLTAQPPIKSNGKSPVGPVLDPKGLKTASGKRIGATPKTAFPEPSTSLPRKELASFYRNVMLSNLEEAHRKTAAQRLVSLKMAKKVSWSTLGISDVEAKQAQHLINPDN